MAYLNINGIEVPIATDDGIDQEYRDDNIDGEFSQGGVYLRVRGDYKKKWSFKTTPLALTFSNPLKDMLNGGGKNWSMNNTLYSSKGKKLTYSRASTKYDEAGVIHNSGIQCDEAGQFGTDRCIGLHRGCTNLLTDNQASVETDTTGFATYGAGSSIARSSTYAWTSTYSLKVDTTSGGANTGATTSSVATTVNLKYTASVWVRGTGTVQIWLSEYTAADALVNTTASSTYTLSAAWQRLQVSRTFGATGAKARILVVTASSQTITYYCDGWQLERSYTNEGATPWQLPSVPRANEFCYTEFENNILDGFTVSFWVYITAELKNYATIFYPYLFTCKYDAANPLNQAIGMRHDIAAANWILRDNVGTVATISDTYTPSNAWAHIRISYDRNKQLVNVWINGTQRATNQAVTVPSASFKTYRLVIGNYQTSDSTGSYYYANTKFADVQILDFPTDENWLSPTTFAHSLLPFLKVHGDLVKATSAAPVTCVGSVKGSKIIYVGREPKEELEVEIEET